MNLKHRKLEAERNVAAFPEKIKRSSIRNNGLNLDLLLRRTDHTLIEVHLASRRPWRWNFYVESAQSNLVNSVWMKNQSGPGPHDSDSIDGGQSRNMRIAVSVEDQAFCYVTRVGEEGAVKASHLNLALKGPLQQRLHLTIAERPERKHERYSDKRKSKGP